MASNSRRWCSLGWKILRLRPNWEEPSWGCTDLPRMQFRVNIGPTRKQVCLEPDLNEETVDNMLVTQKLTKRLCLRLTMMQYDPLGVATPVILRLKALMQRTISPEYGLDWDAELPAELEQAWHQLIKLLVRRSQINF